jgi:hypothetical protein
MILVGSAACSDGVIPIPEYFGAVPVRGPHGNDPLEVSWSAYVSRERIVVRDAAQWATVWPNISQDPLPTVDFTTSIVIVVAMGTQPTGGFSTGFYNSAQIGRDGSVLAIEIRETTPGDCIVTQATTRPAAVAVIPRRPETIQYYDVPVVRSCK